MKTMKTKKTKKIAQLLTTTLLLSAATSASAAGLFAHGIPGASCKPSNQFHETHFEAIDQQLVNTGTESFDIFVAACPVSEVERSASVEEIRVLLRDEEERESWCRMVGSSGEELDFDWSSAEGRGRMGVYFGSPPWGHAGLLEATFYCLLHPGASVERIVVIWQDH